MLDNGKPVIIYSIPGIKIHKSHAWNIDGYKYQHRMITVKAYVRGELVETYTVPDVTPRMVHCDFGWGGTDNGYYVSGVFKLNDPQAEKDGYSSNNNTNYNNYLKVVLYDTVD